MLDYVKKIDPDLYRMLDSLLKTGKIEKNGKLIDFSPVQTIEISGDKITFNPPLRVAGKFGVIRINSTITEISGKAANSILIDIDSSPFNVEIQPDA